MNQDGHHQADGFADEGPGSREVLQALMRFARIAQYRQATILWTLAASLGLGATYYALAPRYYRSEAKLMVVEQKGDDVAGVADQAGADNVMATHKELVRSPVVIRRAIERLAPEHRVDLLEEPPGEWVETLGDRLSTTAVRKTNFIGVGYESLRPDAAAAVVSAVIDAYIEFVGQTHRSTAADVVTVLKTERTQLEESLAAKQRLLRESRERIGHLSLPDRDDVVDPIIGRALRINEALMQAQEERIRLQASLATVRGAVRSGEDLGQHVGLVQEAVGERMMLAAMGLGDGDVALIVEQQKRLLELRAELDRLRPYYGPAHPEVASLAQQAQATEQFIASYRSGRGVRPDALPAEELGPILDAMLSQALAAAVERERQMEQSFEVARAAAARQSGEFVDVEMLQREVERLEKLHDLLFDKIAAVDIRQVQAPIRVNIVQEPLPDDTPASPQLRLALAGSLLGGLALGLGIVYVQDLADDRFGSPDEMAMQLGCRVLAIVRKLSPTGGSGLDAVQVFARPQAAESEAFRTLRTSIALGAEVSERLVVSSAEPGDGKTTVSSNLAASYAQSGKRTLVIDADLRKPGLTALLDLKGRPGTTDILGAEGDIGAVAERCVHVTALDKLHAIPAGARRPDPAELLLGPNFAELLAWAESRYDQVIVDCPPVLAVSDAQIVARLVDGVVLVVTPEKNHRRLVARACDSFSTSGAPLLGVVANRVSEQAGGYGYGYGYGYGHEEGDDADTAAAESLGRAA